MELCAATDAPDTDFTAKLIDVYPPSADYPTGFTLNLTDGTIRCRFRRSFERPEPVRPGEIMRLRIELFATVSLFQAGHRLRVDISSSNFPKFDINPNKFRPRLRSHAGEPKDALAAHSDNIADTLMR